MREENQNQTKTVKFADQNQAPNKPQSGKNGGVNHSKPRSSWGSNIVKGFTADKKTKLQNTIVVSKKLPLSNSDIAGEKGSIVSSHSRVKRSLIGDLSCSVNPAQIHPHSYQTHRRQSSGSKDLFLELDSLRNLLQESKEREFKLQAELSELKRSPKILEIERELEVKKSEADDLVRRVGLLEEEKTNLAEQLSLVVEKNEGEGLMVGSCSKNLEMEVVELRRLNKELQMQKRNLACKLSSMESQLTSLAKASESDIVTKIKAEASLLRHTNQDLCKQVEGLQMSRLNEVEELAYLRWVNSCLRDELRNSGSTEKASSPDSAESVCEIVGFQPSQNNECLEYSVGKRLNLIKKLKKWPNCGEDAPSLECPDNLLDKTWVQLEEERSPRRRHSISGSKCSVEELTLRKRRQSDGFISAKDMEKEEEPLASHKYENCLEVNNINRMASTFDVEKRALRIPNPPPRPSCSISSGPKEDDSAQIPLPPPPPPLPPPPPPPKFSVRSTTGVVQRAPQVVEFYHSLMKRDSRKDSSNGGISEAPDVANVRSSMIGEIENRSSHLLAIKADVATQGEFVKSLIREVNNAVYQNIEDVVAFVKWLDDELCFLVDERAVLKHFDWPEKKADTLREAAFGYRDLKKLETEVYYYKDDARVPCDIALKKMVALSEKMERTVYNLFRTREFLMRNCKEFKIPTDWMLD
ncbi:protein CHUP1, chloroplastic-like, partial [Pistacia vera]|uniref:protein CHUP1, chloroplastic-like n=1 Tax=Pistacia vera TaxID=55513 RepID=UPI001263A62C